MPSRTALTSHCRECRNFGGPAWERGPVHGARKKNASLSFFGILKYYQLGFSWNEIGDKNNLSATFDFIHLNERSGILLEHLVQQIMKTTNDLNF